MKTADQKAALKPAFFRTFEAFTPDNDPRGEHDFGAIEEVGVRFFWKIDTYDRDMAAHSPDPTDPSVKTRVLTIMLADEKAFR